MNPKLNQPWVPLDRIERLVQLEPALLILGLSLGSWIAYKVFLSKISEERHQSLNKLFRNVFSHLLLGVSFFITYSFLIRLPFEGALHERLTTYVGLGAVLVGAIVFVKVCRILVFEYFFISHMRMAFPVLLVNLFTLLLSIILTAWIGAEIFSIRLTPILATSAIFSLVLGLALQDTLGNLFAGVALQFDKPYTIGDWIEVHSGGQKWVGQVFEISWRATVLIASTEEAITVPNRVMAQAEISNYSAKHRPIIRSILFKLPFGTSIEEAKAVLIRSALTVREVRKTPIPKVYITETNESWVGFKLFYYIDNFGDQFFIADRIYSAGIVELSKAGIFLATHQIQITEKSPTDRR